MPSQSLQQLILEDNPRLRVQRPERFIHQDDIRLVNQGSHQRAPFAHSSGEFVGIMVLEAAQTDLGNILRCLLVSLVGRHAAELQRHLDVITQRAPGQEIVVLGHISDIGVDPGNDLPLVAHLARRRLENTRDHVEQRGLAAAGGADETDELAFLDCEVRILQGENRVSLPPSPLAIKARKTSLASITGFPAGI